tara:strand:+ start:13442 stop:14731 length:1290 start_codon:yes stop_codon:yes gene_type:complete
MAVTHRSISFVKETSFGSLSNSTNLPDHSSYTYVSFPCEMDPIILYGEPIVSERNDTKDGSYFIPAEPDTVYNSNGDRVRRRAGQVQIRLDLQTIGTAANNYTSNYLGALLGSGFKTRISDLTSANVTNVTNQNEFTVAGPSANDIGTLLSSIINGKVEYSAITEVTGNDIKVSPAFSAGFTGTPTVYGTQTWYPGSRTETGSKGDSLSFRIDGVNFRTYAYGCVLESLSISLDNGRWIADMTFQSACIQDDHVNASGPVEPVYNIGAPPFFRNSYVVLSTTSPTSLTNASSGDTLARLELDCEDFTCTITNTLTPLANSESILGMSNYDISNVDVELNLTLSTVNTAIQDDFFKRAVKQVIVGSGPGGDGKGAAIMIPAAMLTNDPSAYDVSGNDIVRQTLNYKQSRFGGDTLETNAGNSPFRISLGI